MATNMDMTEHETDAVGGVDLANETRKQRGSYLRQLFRYLRNHGGTISKADIQNRRNEENRRAADLARVIMAAFQENAQDLNLVQAFESAQKRGWLDWAMRGGVAITAGLALSGQAGKALTSDGPETPAVAQSYKSFLADALKAANNAARLRPLRLSDLFEREARANAPGLPVGHLQPAPG